MGRSKDQSENGETTSAIGRRISESVRSIRKRKGWTLEQLAAASGVSRSMLSQIERNGANPTVAPACRIAQAFGLSLSAIVDDSGDTDGIEIVRGDDRTFHCRLDRKRRWRTLSPLHLEKDLEFHELQLKPGGILRSSPHFKGTCEFLTVERGMVRVTTGDESCDLASGDSAYYPADRSHAVTNIGQDDAVMFLVVACMRERLSS